MSRARAPMRPPALAGFEHLRLLGSGGYADVFLYQQEMPRREVAIKVLLAEGLGDKGRQQFYDEANAMAAVSTHPYIVTVFHAAVSDDGHPYLVMEYYPRQNFSVRSRSEQMPVADVLRTGIQVASAVETAHRAGILHRDIKPANILTSAYNRPGLTDFGIATSATGVEEAEGMSIPWSPPEVINGTAPGDATADVYGLASTVYTLLAGRSPYEVTGGANRSMDLIGRIEAGPPPPTGRADVPESLERALRHGMATQPLDRPGSALELARLLQSVEQEQGWAATPIEVSEEPGASRPRGADGDDEDGTRLKAPVVIDGQSRTAPTTDAGSTVAAARARSTDPDPGNDRTSARGAMPPAPGLISGVGVRPVGLSGYGTPRPVQPMPSTAATAGDAVAFEPQPADVPAYGEPASPEPTRSTARVVMIGAGAVLAVVALIVVLGVLGLADETEGGTTTTGDTTDTTPLPPTAPSKKVTDLKIIDGPAGQVVSWDYDPETLPDTSFQVSDQRGTVVGGSDLVGVTSVVLEDPVVSVKVVAQTEEHAPSEGVQADVLGSVPSEGG